LTFYGFVNIGRSKLDVRRSTFSLFRPGEVSYKVLRRRRISLSVDPETANKIGKVTPSEGKKS